LVKGIRRDGEYIGKTVHDFSSKEYADSGRASAIPMVFGFAKQSGGHAMIDSKVEKGTAVKAAVEETTGIPLARGEAVLVVEDELDLRATVVTMLRELGYRVLEAGDGLSALGVMAQNSWINLLLTDVVLPGGMGGREVAMEVERRFSGVKVLFMSGFPRNAVTRHGLLDEGVPYIGKPFRKIDVARKIREALAPVSSSNRDNFQHTLI